MALHARTARLIIGTAAILAGGAAAAAPDLTGIWQIQGSISHLTTVEGAAPPLQPAAAAIYQTREAQAARGDHSFDPSITACKPPGEPRIMYQHFPFEITQLPKQIIFTYAWNRLFKIVDIDQTKSVIAPTYFGTSEAHWNGDVLQIEVSGIHDDTLLDDAGLPHSAQLHLTERFELQNAGKQLVLSIRIDDPASFTRPWDTKVTFTKLDTDRLGESICEERLGLVKEPAHGQ